MILQTFSKVFIICKGFLCVSAGYYSFFMGKSSRIGKFYNIVDICNFVFWNLWPFSSLNEGRASCRDVQSSYWKNIKESWKEKCMII